MCIVCLIKNFLWFMCSLSRRWHRCPEALLGHVLPVASVNDFVQTPGRLRHATTRSTPDQICMLVVAKTKPTPEPFQGIIRVRHEVVLSCCDAQSTGFVMEAVCTLADMFVYNMGDGKPRYAVGSLRQADDKSKIFTVCRLFTIEMELETAKALHMAEVERSMSISFRTEAEGFCLDGSYAAEEAIQTQYINWCFFVNSWKTLWLSPGVFRRVPNFVLFD